MDAYSWASPALGETGLLMSRQSDGAPDMPNLQGSSYQANMTDQVISQLRFATSKSVRTSTIILASFNAAVAFATAVGVFWDGYVNLKKRDSTFTWKRSWHRILGPIETYPFFLSCGIAIQATIFAVSQSSGLQALLVLGCTSVARTMLPALFIVPFLQTAFTIETMIGALRQPAFPNRSKWALPTCIGLALIGIMVAVSVAQTTQPPNFCFASLLWFVSTWRQGCFVILLIVASILLVGAILTFVQVYRCGRVSSLERVAASHMVYYMALGALSNALVAPFFLSMSAGNPLQMTGGRIELAMAATVTANLSGITTGGIYLFLRSCRSSRVNTKDYYEFDRQEIKKDIRLSPRRNVAYYRQMALPVSPPESTRKQMRRPVSSFYSVAKKARDDRDAMEEGSDSKKEEAWEPVSPKTPGPPEQETPQAPPSARLPSSHVHQRKPSYTIFPQVQENSELKGISVLPAAAYTGDSRQRDARPPLEGELLPPPTILGPGGVRHQRDSSLGSSATVQIGLRLSNINDMPPYPSPLKPSDVEVGNPWTTGPPESYTSSVKSVSDSASAKPPKPLVEKQLPPIPLETFRQKEGEKKQSAIRLSPNVYSPERKASKAKAEAPARPGGTSTSSSPRSQHSRKASRAEATEWI